MSRVFDSIAAAAVITDQFPHLCATHVTYLGEGYDSVAVDVDGRWVFRFPKRDDVEQQLLLEARVVPVLAAESPIPLPAFCFLGRPSRLFSRHFGGYPKLFGLPASALELDRTLAREWASSMGHFLSWLHSFPVERALQLGVQPADFGTVLGEAHADVEGDLINVAKFAPQASTALWRRYLSKPPGHALSDLAPVLAHCDLAAEHVLCDERTHVLTGVIDWSELAISDRAIDWAGLFHWGGRPFVDATLAAYSPAMDEATLQRARYLAACRGAADVTFGLELEQPQYVAGGLRALKLCIE